ncbi:hypothetical protein [Haloplanus salilacus]|uniref:hypothetical protein n=1 Tax=Haloplanus salilacus TaxID=2949994 RepID=UPI0030CF2EF2
MNARQKSSALWGVVGALSFLVLVQGYRLLLGPLGVGTAVVAVVTLAVAGATTGLSYVLEPRMRENGRS